MLRTFFFLIAFGMTVIGFTYIIAYLNLLSMGYSFINYLLFIIKRYECLVGIIGLIMITVIILTKGEEYDLHI